MSLAILRNLSIKFDAHIRATAAAAVTYRHHIPTTTRHLSSTSLDPTRHSTQSTARCCRTSTQDKHNAKGSTSQAIDFKILPHNSEFDDNNLIDLQDGSNIELSDLELNNITSSASSNHKSLVFNLSWLRDSCHCDQCTHRYSRQRLFTPKDFNRKLFQIDEVKLVPASDVPQFKIPSPLKSTSHNSTYCLAINWADGHESFYSLDWLKSVHNLYHNDGPKLDLKGGRHLARRHMFSLPSDDFYSPVPALKAQQEYWTVSSIKSHLEPVNYCDLIDGFKFRAAADNEPTFINSNPLADMTPRRFKSILSLTNQLVRFGLAKIINVPLERDQVLQIARSLAYERPTGYGTIFDVVVEPSEEINLAYSAQEFDLHSDLTYREKSPGVQLLHCIRNSVNGGLSYFSDAFEAAEQLRQQSPKLFEVLVQFPAIFVVRDPYRDIKFRRQQPILSLNQQGELSEVHYSPFMLPAMGHRDDVKLFYLALDKYTQLLQAHENKLVLKMDPGDLFIFNNRRVLHGRSSYDPTTSNRFLQGCYMDWDEVECLHEKFHSNNNKH